MAEPAKGNSGLLICNSRRCSGSGSSNSFRDPRTYQHPNDNALRASGGGTETLCCRQIGDFQVSGNGGSDGKESAGHHNFRYSAMKGMKMNVHNSLKDLVGAPRFELGTSCAQGRRATRLRYAPTCTALLILKHFPTLLQSKRPRKDSTVPKLYQILFTEPALYQNSAASRWRGGSSSPRLLVSSAISFENTF